MYEGCSDFVIQWASHDLASQLTKTFKAADVRYLSKAFIEAADQKESDASEDS